MTGPYPPDHGTVPTDVTVTRDGGHVVVCGVRLTEEEARRVAAVIFHHVDVIRVQRETVKRQAEEVTP